MPTCDCKGAYILVAGVRFSRHYEPSHWSRINRGKKQAKAKVKKIKREEAAPFSSGSTDAEQKKLLATMKEQQHE